MSLVVGGLRRLLGAPIPWVLAWIFTVTVAGVVGLRVRLLTAAAVRPFDALDLERVVFGTIDVLRDHPALGAEIVLSVIASAVVGGLAWTLLGPLLIARLAGHRPWSELGARALSTLLPVLVQSLWHLMLRALLVIFVVLSTPAAALWVTLPLAWLVAGVALDATRVAVVEHDAAPWHPRTAWRGLTRTIRRPGLLAACVVLGLGQLLLSVAILWLALTGYGEGSAWPARVITLLSVGLGLWRLGVVIEDAAADPVTEA